MKDWIGNTQGLCISGVNSGVRPDLIGPDQVSWLVNGTVRDGKPRTRIQLIERLTLPAGKVQGAGFFSIGKGYIILSIAGEIYRVFTNGTSFTSENVPLAFNNSGTLPHAWMQETVGNFIIQDGQSNAIIYDGSVARRADPTMDEVPIGRQMAYGNGRLWVAVNEKNLKAGDINSGPNTELSFTETTYLLGGGAFYFPRGIRGLAFMPVNNTNTGYGSLMVFGKTNVDSLRAEIIERDLWQIIPGFQTIVLDNIGTCAHEAIVRVNQDLYWRDPDGQIRSLRSAAQDAQGPGNSPLSREVSRIVDFETKAWLDQVSGIYFDNRLLFTAAPFQGTALDGTRWFYTGFGKLISLDCAPLATMRGKAPPAYDGEWQGLTFTRVVQGVFNGKPRAFVIATSAGDDTSDVGYNSLWEIVPSAREDSYLDSEAVQTPVSIESAVEFRSFDFEKPSALKRLTRCDVYPTMIEGDVDIQVQWRVGNRTQWHNWGDAFTICATMTDTSPATVNNLIGSPKAFDNAAWTKTNYTVTTGQAGPFGGTDAQLIKETAVTNTHVFYQTITNPVTGTDVYEAVIYVKGYGGRTRGQLELFKFGNQYISGAFDISDQSIVVSASSGGGYGLAQSIGGYVQSLGSGWYKVQVHGNFDTASGQLTMQFYGADDTGGLFYLGDITKGFYAWFAQVQIAVDAHVFKNLHSQERGRVKSLTIPQLTDAVQNVLQSVGYTFQIRLVWTGIMTLERVDVWALLLADRDFSNLPNLSATCAQDAISDNEIVYSIVPA